MINLWKKLHLFNFRTTIVVDPHLNDLVRCSGTSHSARGTLNGWDDRVATTPTPTLWEPTRVNEIREGSSTSIKLRTDDSHPDSVLLLSEPYTSVRHGCVVYVVCTEMKPPGLTPSQITVHYFTLVNHLSSDLNRRKGFECS